MREEDYDLLSQLEDAFERKDLQFFEAFLARENLPLLLRVHAVCMLEHVGTEAIVPALCNVLKEDPSPLTRHEAAFTLGQLGYRSSIKALIDAMHTDPSPIVRHESAVALSSLGDPSALPELRKATKDTDEDVRNSATIAYEYLTYLKRKADASGPAVKPKIRL